MGEAPSFGCQPFPLEGDPRKGHRDPCKGGGTPAKGLKSNKILRVPMILKKAQELMRKLGIPAWLIFTEDGCDQNSQLLLGKHLFSRHAIIVPARGKPRIFVRGLEAALLDGRADLCVIKLKEKREFSERLRKEAGKYRELAINYVGNLFQAGNSAALSYLSHDEYLAIRAIIPKNCHIVSSRALQHELRYKKSSQEVKLHRKACQVIEDVVEAVLPNMKGLTESEVAIQVEEGIRRRDCDLAFRTIVASGSNSAIPHHDRGNRKIRKGDIVFIDAGAAFQMRCSDITRTVCIGKASRLQKRIYSIVKEAQRTGIEAIRPGVRAGDVNAICDWVLSRHDPECIMHGAGHPLGLRVHDVGPSFSNTHKERLLKLEEGMIMTVEPGLYLSGKFGVRIEDDVLVTKSGCKLLTHSPDTLIEI